MRAGAEGIVSKRVDSVYRPGQRARTWIKTKCWKEHAFLIGGYTETRTREYPHGALLLGAQDEDGQLHYAGRISLGRSEEQAQAVKDMLAPTLTDAPPFTTTPSRTARWTQPQFTARVRFLEITSRGEFRHATLREIASRPDG